MQELFNLIHSLAKEEKRLYNLHGKDTRFKSIYERYMQATDYSKELDRKIYAKHYSEFSKAFYSMQKNALLDDIVAVLLEYSNSSDPQFSINRLKAKANVMIHKGFHELAAGYLQDAIKIARKSGNIREYHQVLERYASILPYIKKGSWKSYQETVEQIQKSAEMLVAPNEAERFKRELSLLIHATKNEPGKRKAHKDQASQILADFKAFIEKHEFPGSTLELIEAENQFQRHFGDKDSLHERLTDFESKFNNKDYEPSLRFRVINLFMESALDSGDFLSIDGLLYRVKDEVSRFPDEVKKIYEPRFTELTGIYYFYEQDIPEAEQAFRKLATHKQSPQEDRARNYYHLIGALIASGRPREAQTTLKEMSKAFQNVSNELPYRMLEAVAATDLDDKNEALQKLQRLNALMKKMENPRSISLEKAFAEELGKFLSKRRTTFQPIEGLDENWQNLMKYNLWLRSKVENEFYMDNIARYWQGRKKVLGS